MNSHPEDHLVVGVQAWKDLLAVCQLLPAALDSAMRKEGSLTLFEFQVLDALNSSADKFLRLSALAESTNTTLPRLSHVISRLEERGFVKRTACQADRRATNAELTDDGRVMLARTSATENAASKKYVLDVLTQEQLADLARTSALIIEALKNVPKDPGKSRTQAHG